MCVEDSEKLRYDLASAAFEASEDNILDQANEDLKKIDDSPKKK